MGSGNGDKEGQIKSALEIVEVPGRLMAAGWAMLWVFSRVGILNANLSAKNPSAEEVLGTFLAQLEKATSGAGERWAQRPMRFLIGTLIQNKIIVKPAEQEDREKIEGHIENVIRTCFEPSRIIKPAEAMRLVPPGGGGKPS